MTASVYSQRLGPITDEQLQAALERFGLGTFARAEPATAGNFGQNVFVTSTTGEYVLRGLPHYDWQLPSERFFCRLLHARTRVPVPWPYLIDPNDDIFGWSYAIMPRLPGLQLSDLAVVAQLSGEDRVEIARAMGENLALMQELTWPFPGRYDLGADTVVPLPGGFAEWLIADVRGWLELARGHSDRTTDADVAWVERRIEAAWGALEALFQPCFVLRDYTEHNVALQRTDAAWRVSGVFDLMEASFGDGEMDLSRQVARYLDEDVELAREFARAYLGHRAPRPGFAERFPVYMLRDRLIIWEYFQRPGIKPWWDPELTLKGWAEPYTASYAAVMGGRADGDRRA